jgi:hypothetical protein
MEKSPMPLTDSKFGVNCFKSDLYHADSTLKQNLSFTILPPYLVAFYKGFWWLTRCYSRIFVKNQTRERERERERVCISLDNISKHFYSHSEVSAQKDANWNSCSAEKFRHLPLRCEARGFSNIHSRIHILYCRHRLSIRYLNTIFVFIVFTSSYLINSGKNFKLHRNLVWRLL